MNTKNQNSKKPIVMIATHAIFNFENHNVNADKQGMPKNHKDKTYISGQKIRYSTLKTISELMGEGNIFGSGDKKSEFISLDNSSLFGGYMKTEKDLKSSTKNASLLCPVAKSINKSNLYINEGTRFDINGTNHMPFNESISENDLFCISRFLDLREFGSRKMVEIKNDICKTKFFKFLKDEEIKSKLSFFIESMSYISGLANQGNKTVDNTPKKIAFIFDTYSTTKKYFNASEKERSNYVKSVIDRGGFVIEGDDDSEKSVSDAISECLEKLNEMFFIFESDFYEYIDEVEFFKKNKTKIKVTKESKLEEVDNG
jgi:CRISPR-associated protein Cas7/Csp1